MGRWKDLGEVPDSDDESLDSLGSQQDGPVDDAPKGDLPETTGVDDPWKIPSSPPCQAGLSPTGPEPSPLSSPLSPPPPSPSPPSPLREQLEGLNNGEATRGPERYSELLAPEPGVLGRLGGSSQKESSVLGDEISRPYVTITAPSSSAGGLDSRPPAIHSSSPTPNLSLGISRLQEAAHHMVFEDDFAAEYGSTLAERSLRPRKPIQQHPYLLENAQYAKFMKRHGVRPLRVTVEPPAQRRRVEEEEDSQDQEFEADPSREPGARTPANTTDESQPALFDDSLDDRDVLALSPHTPDPRSSSSRGRERTSSQQLWSDQTDDTRITEEDFPSLDELVSKPTRGPVKRSKRPASSRLSPSRKRAKATTTPLRTTMSPLPPSPLSREPETSVWDMPLESPRPRSAVTPPPVDTSFVSSPDLPLGYRRGGVSLSVDLPSRQPTPSPRRPPPSSHVVDLTGQDGDDAATEAETNSSDSDRDSGSDVIRHNVKRIRGVLPASWLRLDQQNGHGAAQRRRRSSDHRSPGENQNEALTPNPNPRRGVALPRQSSPKPRTAIPIFSDDDSDDDHENHNNDDDDDGNDCHGCRQESVRPPSPEWPLFNGDDDGGSVVEEDHIDGMLSGTKRRSSSTGGGARSKRAKTFQQVAPRGPRREQMRQPKISQVLGRSHTVSSSRGTTTDTSGAVRQARRPSRPSERKRPVHAKKRAPPLHLPSPPPRLSILDVVEPGAPQFLRVAARRARAKKDRGKSSPSRKHIELGNRGDNIDALSVLRDWKAGKIRPRIPDPVARPDGQATRQPLGERSANATAPGPDPGPDPSDHDGGRRKGQPRPPSRVQRDHAPSVRPAQLEIDDDERPERARFVARKRALDSLYRRRGRGGFWATADSDDGSERARSGLSRLEMPERQETATTTKETRKNNKSRFRKRSAPKQIDLAAPRFEHANDPLPDEPLPDEPPLPTHEPIPPRPADEDAGSSGNKLLGLGPYGTVYTQHFEIFPLDRGVFFHSSTVLGRGCVRAAVDPAYGDKVRQPRPSASFEMDGRALRWGRWDDNVSSELGILVDWIGEQLLSPSGALPSRRAVDGADFVLSYILDSISLADEEADKLFIARAVEVFQGFVGRLGEASASGRLLQVEVLVRFAVAILAVHRLQQSCESGFAMAVQVEELMVGAAGRCVDRLLATGLDDLRTLYGDLQQLSGREGGIRRDRVAANAWVVLVRVLESAGIPRGSFWDVTQAAMMRPGTKPEKSAPAMEALWRDMFTLLPLSEFDDSGVLVAGRRHSAAVEGWGLPQRLLKQVLELYAAERRQAPGFNEYCRALAARCHWLVRQWGWWRRCGGVVGTLFDFFGAQDLAHLRNEEAHASPRFLENLHRGPSLEVEAEDRCFHVFIKLLGLAIRRLGRQGPAKDVRNLIARTLPNHDRQHPKEHAVRRHELAALRNHHDLVVTLFWAAPAALRPSASLVEKLVAPGSAHREAVVINLRAWSQLARFVATSTDEAEGAEAFQPLARWQANMFRQLLDQYLSAAPDIRRQRAELSRRVSSDVVDATIRRNKAAAMDVLYLCVKASLDVLKLSASLSRATATLNITQLRQVFTRLDWASPGFDWSVMVVAVEMLEHYVAKTKHASEAQYSSSSQNHDPQDAVEEAVLLLVDKLAEPFFSMTRSLLEQPDPDPRRPGPSDRSRCIEKAVTLSARLAALFIEPGITRTVDFFTSKKYGVFGQLPADLDASSPRRTYLPLFLAALVQDNVFDFRDVGLGLLGLWLVALVKPARALCYEAYLAGVLQQKDIPYLRHAAVPVGVVPDYDQHRDWVAAGLSFMREDLRRCPPASRRQRRDEHARSLQTAMDRMREDLRALRGEEGETAAAEHKRYMEFVRQVVSLIRSHGVSICAVDPFFTQAGPDYAPPAQDPQLHAAGIVAYGIRLGEGELTAAPQLFYYLYNNFKLALAHHRLGAERQILAGAMAAHRRILSFVLARALPALVWATSRENKAWPLLDVYLGALRTLLTRSSVPRELGGPDGDNENDIGHAASLVQSALTWLRTLRVSSTSLSQTQLYLVVRLVEMACLFQPSLTTYLLSREEQKQHTGTGTIDDAVLSFVRFADAALAYLDGISSPAEPLDVGRLTGGLQGGDGDGDGNRNKRAPLVFGSGRELDPQVDGFANMVATDVGNNWDVSAVSVGWNAGSGSGRTAHSTVSQPSTGLGIPYEFPSRPELVQELRCLLRSWKLGRGVRKGSGRRARRVRVLGGDEPLIF